MFEPPTDLVEAEPNPDYDQIAGAHGLLASYPFASATPTSHGMVSIPLLYLCHQKTGPHC